MVSPELKQRVDEAARASGRTQSQEAEQLIEQGLAVRDVLGSLRTTIPEVARRQAEANFRERGYTVIHDPHGDIWLPPGHPAKPPSSGFIPPE
jgi:predicted transcriptional regulator